MDSMTNRLDSAKEVGVRLLTGMPIVLLAIMALSWLKYGIDLPLLDDWRDYDGGVAGTFKLSVLFQPANDTLYPVGRLLDALAFRLLGGNAIAYQFLSMTVVLGLLLFFQWRLLMRVLDDRFAAACCFGLTVFMLQPDSYWGLQSLAYHQAIPLICLLVILDLATGNVRSWACVTASSLFLGLVSGLAYISGAFAMAVAGTLLCLAASRLEKSERGNLAIAGVPTLIAGLATLPAQVWVIVVYQHGTHRPDAPMAYPHEYDFWMYLFGKVGRALMLRAHPAALSFVIVLAVIAVCAMLMVWCLRPLSCGKAVRSRRTDCGILFAVLGAVIFVYLLLVAAGRTNLRNPAMVDPLAIFSFAYGRFHFFWVTLLWPWTAAAAFLYFRARPVSDNRLQIGLGVVCSVVVAVAFGASAAQLGSSFRKASEMRERSMSCIIESMHSGSDLAECKVLDVRVARSGIEFGIANGASFARVFKYLATNWKPSGPPIFKLSEAKASQLSAIHTSLSRLPSGEVQLVAGADPGLLIDTADAAKLGACTKLLVTATVEAATSDIAELYYLEAGEVGYSQAHSRSFFLPAGAGGATGSFYLRSDQGFGKVLRFDPVTKAQAATVRNFEVRCDGSK